MCVCVVFFFFFFLGGGLFAEGVGVVRIQLGKMRCWGGGGNNCFSQPFLPIPIP